MVAVGFDVGAASKGFHGAALSNGRLVDYCQGVSAEEALAFAHKHHPGVIAVDSPRRAAEPGQKSRANERLFSRQVGSVFFTPDQATIEENDFYSWMRHGFLLYRLLEEKVAQAELIEVFPTSLWKAILGPRDKRSRTKWSSEALAQLNLADLPQQMGQDLRDAIGAAYLGQLYLDRRTINFDDLIAPDPDNVLP